MPPMLKSCPFIRVLIIFVLVFTFLIPVLPLSSAEAGHAKSILNVLQKNKNFSKFYRAVRLTGAGKRLAGNGRYTLLAPTDSAFQKLEQSVPGSESFLFASANRNVLRHIVETHIIRNILSYSQLRKLAQNKNKRKRYLDTIRRGDDGLLYLSYSAHKPAAIYIVGSSGAFKGKLLRQWANIAAVNGYLQGIDRLLIPQSAVEAYIKSETPTPTPEPVLTQTPVPTQTPSPTNTPTVPPATATMTPSPSNTASPTLTSTGSSTTATPTPTATEAGTGTPSPTATSSPVPTLTPTTPPSVYPLAGTWRGRNIFSSVCFNVDQDRVELSTDGSACKKQEAARIRSWVPLPGCPYGKYDSFVERVAIANGSVDLPDNPSEPDISEAAIHFYSSKTASVVFRIGKYEGGLLPHCTYYHWVDVRR